jgi:hypothetical protein
VQIRYPLNNSINKIQEGKHFIKTFPESIETEVEKGFKLYETSLDSIPDSEQERSLSNEESL